MPKYTYKNWVPPRRTSGDTSVIRLTASNSVYTIDNKYLPAEHVQFKVTIQAETSGLMSAASSVSTFYILCIGEGDFIRDSDIAPPAGNITGRFSEKNYARILFEFYSMPDYAEPINWLSFDQRYRVSGPGVAHISNMYLLEYYGPTGLPPFPNPPVTVNGFNRNKVKGIINRNVKHGFVDKNFDSWGQYEEYATIDYIFFFPQIFNTQLSYLNEAIYNESNVFERWEEQKPFGIKIKKGAKIAFRMVKEHTGFSWNEALNGVALLKGAGFEHVQTIQDRNNSGQFIFYFKENEGVKLDITRDYKDYQSRLLTYINDEYSFKDFSVSQTDSGEIVVAYDKKSRNDIFDKTVQVEVNEKDPAPLCKPGPGLWVSLINSIGEKGKTYVKYLSVEDLRAAESQPPSDPRFRRKAEAQISRKGQYPVTNYVQNGRLSYTAYWCPERLKLHASIEALQLEECSKAYRDLSAGWPKNKMKYLAYLDAEDLENNARLLSFEEFKKRYVERTSFRLKSVYYKKLNDQERKNKTVEHLELTQEYVEAGSIFLNVCPVSIELLSRELQEGEAQEEQQWAEDYLLYPVPRDSQTSVPEQWVGFTVLDDGHVLLIVKLENEKSVRLLYTLHEDRAILVKSGF